MPFVLTKARNRTFGLITPSHADHIGQPSAPIWLPVGISGARGYGNPHCQDNPSRMKQVNGAGFIYFSDFCEFVAGGFTRICDAKRGDLSIVRRHDGFDCELIIRFKDDGEGTRWDIVTGVISRANRDSILWP